MDRALLKFTAGQPFKWSWLLFDDTLATNPFDSLANYVAHFTCSTSPIGSRFAKLLLHIESGVDLLELMKVEPNRIDLELKPVSTALCRTGFYEVALRHTTDSNLDVLVARGPTSVALQGTAFPVVEEEPAP